MEKEKQGLGLGQRQLCGAGFAPPGCAGIPELPRRWLRWRVRIHKLLGTLLTLNFATLWLAPVMIQGQSYRRGLVRCFRPLYRLVDESPAWRRFAVRRVYRRKADAAYFTAAVLSATGTVVAVGVLLAWQIALGSLAWWLVVIYYFHWVGPGGRGMGTAYTLAHREGHRPAGKLYRPWIGKRLGNLFENRLGAFHGVVPHNFSTSHVLLHHRLNGGKGDPIYLWDLDRTKWGDLMLYQWRMLRWMSGFASLAEFRRQSGMHPGIDRARATLRRGMIVYWICTPAAILAILIATGSSLVSALLFLFFVYLQPLLAMSTFLALINVGQHGFLEFDSEGRQVPLVTAGTILDGHDDSFGEDYHFAHHFAPGIGQDRLSEHFAAERFECARVRGAVFEKTSIFELAIMMHLGRFEEMIRRHYVDFAGDGDVGKLARLFERRAKRREMSYEDYEFNYLPTLRQRVRELVRNGTCTDENRAYIYQAHRAFERIAEA